MISCSLLFVRLAGVLVFVIWLLGCSDEKVRSSYIAQNVSDAAHGKELIRAYGCGACHVIPGIREARGLVGPPLLYFGQRTMIAGQLPNSSENLIHWIEHPRAIEPKTAMPDLGLSEEEASDVAAYLLTL